LVESSGVQTPVRTVTLLPSALEHGRISMKGIPMAFRFAPAVPPLAVVTCRMATRVPAAVGVKLTVTWQDAPGARAAAQVVDAITKSALASPVVVTVSAPVSLGLLGSLVTVKVTPLLPPLPFGAAPFVRPMTVALNSQALPGQTAFGSYAWGLDGRGSAPAQVVGGSIVSRAAAVPVPCTVRVPETVPSPMVTVPVALPTTVGAKWTATAQVLAGARPAAQPLPATTKPLPGAETVSGPVAAPPLLVTVKVVSALTALTEMEPKSYELGDTVSAPWGRPMPDSWIEPGFPDGALTLRTAVNAPAAAGLRATLTVQVPAAASEMPVQVSALITNSGSVTASASAPEAVVPVFFTVKVWAVPVLPRRTEPRLAVPVTVRVAGPTETQVRAAVTEVAAPLLSAKRRCCPRSADSRSSSRRWSACTQPATSS